LVFTVIFIYVVFNSRAESDRTATDGGEGDSPAVWRSCCEREKVEGNVSPSNQGTVVTYETTQSVVLLCRCHDLVHDDNCTGTA